MEKNLTDRIPFRVESPRGDDMLGTNTKTGEIISDFDARTQGVPFQSGIPRDKIQKAIEDSLIKEKWVCVEKQDGSTELLTKKDLPIASDEKPVEATATVKAGQPEEPPKPVKEDWKNILNGASSPLKSPWL